MLLSQLLGPEGTHARAHTHRERDTERIGSEKVVVVVSTREGPASHKTSVMLSGTEAKEVTTRKVRSTKDSSSVVCTSTCIGRSSGRPRLPGVASIT